MLFLHRSVKFSSSTFLECSYNINSSMETLALIIQLFFTIRCEAICIFKISNASEVELCKYFRHNIRKIRSRQTWTYTNKADHKNLCHFWYSRSHDVHISHYLNFDLKSTELSSSIKNGPRLFDQKEHTIEFYSHRIHHDFQTRHHNKSKFAQ